MRRANSGLDMAHLSRPRPITGCGALTRHPRRGARPSGGESGAPDYVAAVAASSAPILAPAPYYMRSALIIRPLGWACRVMKRPTGGRRLLIRTRSPELIAQVRAEIGPEPRPDRGGVRRTWARDGDLELRGQSGLREERKGEGEGGRSERKNPA